MDSHQPTSPEMLLSSDSAHEGVPPFRELVSIEPYGAERFRGISPLHWPGHRVFGGIVAGQALQAAGHTVSGLRPHSMHAYFLQIGRPEIPLDYAVTRVRDGRSFATRSVEVTQAGSVIFTMLASFHRAEPGEQYQLHRAADVAVPAHDAQSPQSVLPHLEVLDDLDVQDVGATEPRDDGTFASTRRMWLRVREDLPDDPLLHASILTLMSDMGMVTAARPPAMWRDSRPTMAASLDHAVWFHRDIRVDDWLLYDLHSVSVAGSRALARGVMHAAGGDLVASITQEALIRTSRE
ncbi:MAG: acyl-CoA thioesterase [Cumulibacter sp.]